MDKQAKWYEKIRDRCKICHKYEAIIREVEDGNDIKRCRFCSFYYRKPVVGCTFRNGVMDPWPGMNSYHRKNLHEAGVPIADEVQLELSLQEEPIKSKKRFDSRDGKGFFS